LGFKNSLYLEKKFFRKKKSPKRFFKLTLFFTLCVNGLNPGTFQYFENKKALIAQRVKNFVFYILIV
jgi:hypothetical protein